MSTTSGAADSGSNHDGDALPEESFRLLVQSVRDYAIFMMDSQGYVTT